MSYNHTISAILTGIWMLDRQWAEAQLPIVLSMLKGNPVSFVEREGAERTEQPFVVDPKTMQRYDMYVHTMYGTKRNPNIPENSVGVLPISGPITKYNGTCGVPGAIKQASYLAEMQKSANIGSVIVQVDTPGGESRAANAFTTALAHFSKPKLSYVDGMSASLGMWITSGTDEVYLSSRMDQMGSVGSYITLMDMKGYFEKEGVKIHEIYAPQSEDKNKEYREALKGNYSLLEQDLKRHVDEFIGYIKTQRSKAAAAVGEWSTGKMFYADDAVKLGLADGVKDFAQVVSKAAWLSKRKHNHI